jgi:phosphatidylglycerophosphate synthase
MEPTPPQNELGQDNMGPVDRIQENFLAKNERRLLNVICAKMPARVTPDMMTALGMFGALIIMLGYIGSNHNPAWLWISVGGYALHWFGDSTDGSLARFRKIERPRYGYFLDHSCDALGTTMIVGGIGLTPYVSLDLALFALIGYLLLSVHAFLAVRVLGEMKLSYLNAGPTELRFMLIALTLAMLFFGTGPGWFGATSGFDIFTGTIGAILVLLVIIQTSTTVRRLGKMEPPRNDEWQDRDKRS